VKRIQATLKPGEYVAFHIQRQSPGSRGGSAWASMYLGNRLSADSN
jgi:hypothetical protein